MTRQRSTLFPTFVLLLTVVASDAWASSFQLNRVADLSTAIPGGSGTFTNLDFHQPVLSEGNVAFLASGPGQFGIYLFERGLLRRVADLTTPIPGGSGTFTSLGPPALSGSSVAFRGGGDGQEGIYLFNGAVLNRVADLNTPIPDGSRNFDFDFFGQPALSGGIVAFSGGSVNGQEGIYLFNGTALSRVADLNTLIPGGSGTFTPDTFASGVPPLLSGGNVAFLGTGSSGQQGIYLYESGVLVRVADGETLIPGTNVNFVAFLSPVLSGSNVAFLGTDLSREHAGIYLFESGVLSRVADVNTPIPDGSGNFRVTDASYPALSGGNVAALGFGSSGQTGIYLFEGGVLRRVADRNTPIPGESGNFDAFLPPALSGSNVAFLGIGGSLNQSGIYFFEGGTLSRVADSKTPIPGGSGNFDTVFEPALSERNVAFLGFGPSLQEGIYLATPSTTLAAAVLPGSRSVQVGGVASAFATIINAGPATGFGCGIAPSAPVAGATFSYQTTDPATNVPTGTPNTPVDIPAPGLQTFVIAFVPSVPLSPLDVNLNFQCSNSSAAPIVTGLNTFLLSASNDPVPDIVALGATVNGNGIVDIPGTTGTGAFAVATVNVGANASITASADTGSASLPVSIALCQTNPTTGVCLGSPADSVTTQINAGQTPTFGIFVTGAGTVPFDPAKNRVFVRFKDAGGVTRGTTSVAARTQ